MGVDWESRLLVKVQQERKALMVSDFSLEKETLVDLEFSK